MTSEASITVLTDVLYEYVSDHRTVNDFVSRLQEALNLEDQDEAILRELFDLTASLERDGRDGIWARILKNAFMPLFIGRFEYIAGNPPWVNWESLPAGYRQHTAGLWDSYGLFLHEGMDTILGKGKKDISTLMTYVAADRYLAPGGRLGFVITQSAFKTAGAGQGFRRFMLPGNEGLKVRHVDDMSDLQPFEGASNRTTVLILEKGRPTTYPVPYRYWRKSRRGRGLRYDSTLETVTGMTARMNLLAQPVDSKDLTSPWITARPAVLRALQHVLGPSDYEAHAGAYTGGANGVFWLEVLRQRENGRILVVRNIVDGTKRKVEQVTAEVESELVYRLLRPRDLARWSAEPSAHILLVQDLVTRRGIDVAILTRDFPLIFAYLSQFEGALRERAAYKPYFTRQVKGNETASGAFYSMFDIGNYTLSPFKVVWNRIASDIRAAVIDRPIIPQETITQVAVETRDEANYVCALVNSVPFRSAAVAYLQAGGKSFGTPDILNNLRIPSFDENRDSHRRLADLGDRAARMSGSMLSEIETEIDIAAAQVWGIAPSELDEIGRGLAEIQARPIEANGGAQSDAFGA